MNSVKPIYKPEPISEFLNKDDFTKLTHRNNLVALLYLANHIGVLFILGAILDFSLNNETHIITILIYLLYCSTFNFLGTAGAMHEFAHGTVLTHKKTNKIFYKILGLLTWTNASIFQATHFNHHRNFLHETDLEGALGNNKSLSLVSVLGKVFLSPSFVARRIYYTGLSALGIFKSPKLKNLLDDKLIKKVQLDAVAIIIFHSIVIFGSYFANNYYPILFISLPAFLAQYPNYVLASSQHNVDIGTANTYTQLTASVSIQLPFFVRALYWNMNFHSEHHLAPSIPHYNLSKFQIALIRSKNAVDALNLTNFISEVNGNYVKN